MELPIVADAHNDLLLEVDLVGGDAAFADRWLGKLRAGNVRLQVCAVSADSESVPDSALRRSLQLTQAFQNTLEANAQDVFPIHYREDIAAGETDSRVGLALLLEGCEPLCSEPLLADVFFALGFRIFGLTWSVRNAFADGHTETSDGGLSNLGRTLVDRLVVLGAIVDLAHASPRTFDQVLERTGDAPVMVSHAGCKAVYDVPRNVTDAQLKSLAERNGFFGVMCIPLSVHGSDWTLDRLIDHIEHAVAVMGINRVGLGSDFIRQVWQAGGVSKRAEMRAALPPGMDGESIVEGLSGPDEFGNLGDALRERGFGQNDVELIMGGNLIAFLAHSLPSVPGQPSA